MNIKLEMDNTSNILVHTNYIHVQYITMHIIYCIAVSFAGENISTNLAFLWQFANVFSTKIYFQAIRYRPSGCGALGYH